MTWFIFILIGAACGFASAGLKGGKRGSGLLVAVVEGAVTALIIWVVLKLVLKMVFSFLPILIAIVGVLFVLSLLGVGKKS